jgi:hypothetical protein
VRVESTKRCAKDFSDVNRKGACSGLDMAVSDMPFNEIQRMGRNKPFYVIPNLN